METMRVEDGSNLKYGARRKSEWRVAVAGWLDEVTQSYVEGAWESEPALDFM